MWKLGAIHKVARRSGEALERTSALRTGHQMDTGMTVALFIAACTLCICVVVLGRSS